MIMSVIILLLVGVIAYVWASRGFFSALIHMLCTIVAGAIAFALWEPLAYKLLGDTTNQNLILMSWAICLAVPFAVILAALRLATNKLLPSNADLDGVSNLVGGGVCGLVSGTITVGIVLISITFLGLPQQIFGTYKAIGYDGNGSPKREDKLLFAADRITAGFYGHLSQGAFATGTPLAVWRPALPDDGSLLRTNFNDGGSRHTLPPSAFEVLGRYTVAEAGAPAGSKAQDLLKDSLTEQGDRVQNVTNLEGEPLNTAQSFIEGYVVSFKPGAREKSGGIVIGAAQVQLVCRAPEDDRSIALQPVAMVSQQESSSRDLGRWRFDAPGNFFRSAGGGNEAMMAFEFLVPKGARPLALYVKGVRHSIADPDTLAATMEPFSKYAWTTQRDNAIRTGNIFSGVVTGGGELDRSSAITVSMGANTGAAELIVAPRIPDGLVINKDNIGGLEIDEDRQIINGEGKYFNQDLNNRGLDRNLQVNRFGSTEDTKIVTLRVDSESRIGLLTNPALAADNSKAPVLVDDAGQRYAAIGYVYRNQTETHISFLPGRPVKSVTDLPALSGSRPDQKLFLVFRVSDGAKLQHFAIGNKVVGTFAPPVEIPIGIR